MKLLVISNGEKMSLSKWKILSSKQLIDKPFFSLKTDKCELPDGRVMPNYYIFDFSDWVNVIPITENDEIILIRQYRHARKDFFYEVPGGTTHPGKNEAPLLAAKRELLEETGYESDNWAYKGAHSPNPSLQSNQMHTYLAKGCKKVAEQTLDEFEDIEVKLVSKHHLLEMLISGEFEHSLMAASLVRCWKELNLKE